MATETNTPSSLLEQLNNFSAEDLNSNAKTRKAALKLSKKLTESLEDPVNRATDLPFSPFIAIAARIAVEMNLFGLITSAGGPISTSELATQSGGDADLIQRLLRLLADVGFVGEVGEDLWSGTATTSAMTQTGVEAGMRLIFDLNIAAAVKAPRFLRETGFRAPTEPGDTFVQFGHSTKLTAFDYLARDPPLQRHFNAFMGNTMGNRPYWYDWYPVRERLLDGFEAEAPASESSSSSITPSALPAALLVDVGGGKGHDLLAFSRKFCGGGGDSSVSGGRLVLEDLAAGFEGGDSEALSAAGIERREHDFFRAQPEVGARAYFLHHILHDWSDKYCLEILGHLRAAMRPGYSRLLVHELVLPDRGASAYQCIYDMTMMTFNAGMERSRKQWTRLLDRAGFEIVGFWMDDDPDADGIIEALVKG